jgi:hypothetical protein
MKQSSKTIIVQALSAKLLVIGYKQASDLYEH